MLSWLLGIYLLIVTALGIFLMARDKQQARIQTGNNERVPEGRLFFLAILGGSLGIYAGMIVLHHKTQKLSFIVGIPLLIAQQLLLLYFAHSFLLSI